MARIHLLLLPYSPSDMTLRDLGTDLCTIITATVTNNDQHERVEEIIDQTDSDLYSVTSD